MVPNDRPSLADNFKQGLDLPPEVEEGNIEYKVGQIVCLPLMHASTKLLHLMKSDLFICVLSCSGD